MQVNGFTTQCGILKGMILSSILLFLVTRSKMKRRQIPQLCPIYTLLSSPFLARFHALFSFKSYLTTYIFFMEGHFKAYSFKFEMCFYFTFLYKLVKDLNT